MTAHSNTVQQCRRGCSKAYVSQLHLEGKYDLERSYCYPEIGHSIEIHNSDLSEKDLDLFLTLTVLLYH